MRTARELFESPEMLAVLQRYKYEEATLTETRNRLTAAIEADRRELVEACAREAEDNSPDNAGSARAAARVRALTPSTPAPTETPPR